MHRKHRRLRWLDMVLMAQGVHFALLAVIHTRLTLDACVLLSGLREAGCGMLTQHATAEMPGSVHLCSNQSWCAVVVGCFRKELEVSIVPS